MIATLGCAEEKPPLSPEPPIPAHFTTYTDELGLFSISYPPDWELALSLVKGFEESSKELLKSMEFDLPLESTSMIFLAGMPTEIGL